jgi:hypothetical protein
MGLFILGGPFVFQEVIDMWNEPSKERLAKIPRLYETEHVSIRDKLIHLHFFLGESDWYICEFDRMDTFFGFCILNNNLEMAEWGYVSFSELKSIKIQGWLEVDCELEEHWDIKKAIDIAKIRVAHGWPQNNAAGKDFSNENELIMKVKAGHFRCFQDLFSEVTSPYSDFFGVDPGPVWRKAHERNNTESISTNGGTQRNDRQGIIH